MPKLIIHRKKDWLPAGYISTFEVFLDGKRIGYLSDGESVEFDIQIGEHTLKIKFGGMSSKDYEFNIFNKETKRFSVTSFRNITGIIFILIIVFVLLANRLFRISDNENMPYYYFSIAFFLIVLSIYYRTLGRNRYIFLKENKVD